MSPRAGEREIISRPGNGNVVTKQGGRLLPRKLTPGINWHPPCDDFKIKKKYAIMVY